MTAVQRVLVVGAGMAGSATATFLAADGIDVDLVDARPEVGTQGSGITLQGNALRVLRDLGVWEQVLERGYAFDTLGLRAPNPAGTLVAELDEIKTGGPDLPATMGVPRPDLAQVMLARAEEVGARLRPGTAVTGLTQDDDGVDVTFDDGSTVRYDLVVGADGIRSTVRRAIGVEAEPRSTGMGIWRVFTGRPESVTRTDLVYGGPCYIAGYCPTGEDSIYAYLVEDAQDRSDLSPEEALEVVRGLAAAYHGPWDDVRELITDPSRINYTWFETHLVEGDWHRGRVVLVGDAAHACPPTLAQGGAQALEDAAVLSELLLAHDALDDDLWKQFTDRRLDRARTVVEASNQLGQWLLDHERGDVPGLMGRVSALLTHRP